MKKKLIDSCRVRPYTSGAAIDRQNFGSAVLGLKVAAATGFAHRCGAEAGADGERHQQRHLRRGKRQAGTDRRTAGC